MTFFHLLYTQIDDKKQQHYALLLKKVKTGFVNNSRNVDNKFNCNRITACGSRKGGKSDHLFEAKAFGQEISSNPASTYKNVATKLSRVAKAIAAPVQSPQLSVPEFGNVDNIAEQQAVLFRWQYFSDKGSSGLL